MKHIKNLIKLLKWFLDELSTKPLSKVDARSLLKYPQTKPFFIYFKYLKSYKKGDINKKSSVMGKIAKFETQMIMGRKIYNKTKPERTKVEEFPEYFSMK
jgi:hypothetical protein